MSLNEMLTCVRENIAVVAVVFNNQQWGAEKKNQVGCLLYIYRLHITYLLIYLSTGGLLQRPLRGHQPGQPELRGDQPRDGRGGGHRHQARGGAYPVPKGGHLA